MITEQNNDLLNDSWTLYFKDPNDRSSWDIQSFYELASISTIQEYKIIWETIKDKLLCGMFFVFREHIPPVYEDEKNQNGMTISMKFPFHQLHDVFNYFIYRMLGETLVNTDNPIDNEDINGLQFVPKKKQGFVIKLWIKNKQLSDPEKLNLRKDMKDAIFKYDNLG